MERGVQLVVGERTSSARAGRGSSAGISAPSSISRVRFGSALAMTTGAELSSPSVRTPPQARSGHRRAGGDRRRRLQRSLGDRERRGRSHLERSPIRAQPQQVALVVHELTDAVPGSRGPAKAPITPWPNSACLMALVVDVAAEMLGDRLLEHDGDHLGVVSEDALHLGSAGEPTQVSRGPLRSRRRSLEQLAVGDRARGCPAREAVLAQVRGGAGAIEVERHRAAVGQRAPQVGMRRDDS